MLFVVYHKHTAEMCPGGKVHPDPKFMAKLEEQSKSAGVTIVKGYLDGLVINFIS